MRGIRTLKIVTDSLLAVDLTTLRRPSVKPTDPKTEELVSWGICVYVYSLIAHVQKVLVGLVGLAESGNCLLYTSGEKTAAVTRSECPI